MERKWGGVLLKRHPYNTETIQLKHMGKSAIKSQVRRWWLMKLPCHGRSRVTQIGVV